MLKFGDKIISDLYLGDKRIAKAFLGAKLVYKAKGPIFLDYIESNGVACINTDLKPSYDYTIKIKYQYTSLIQTYNPIFGMRLAAVGTGNGLFWVGMHFNEKRAYLRFGENSVNYAMGDKALDVIEMTCSPEGVFINGEDTGARYFNSEITSEAKPICLFTINGESGISPSLGETNAKVYSYQVFDGDMNLIQNLRPCLHPKTLKVCMYDMVSGKYFYNKGTGTLTAGNKINFVDYITFDGDSYIDTLFKPNPHTTRTVLDCMLLDDTSSGGQGIFGARPTTVSSINSMNIWFNTSDAPKTLRLDCTGNYQVTKPDNIDIAQRLLIDCLDKDVTINGITYSSTVDKSNATYLTYSMYLGNFNNVGKPYTKGCKMNVYRFTIYDNGKLAQDLKPCVVNEVACFYDMVTGKLFTNIGTGTLKPSGRFVQSILFDGASWINTGIVQQTCTVETTIRFEENGTRQLMGFGSSTAQYWGKPANSVIIESLSGSNVTDKTDVIIEYNCDDLTAPTIVRNADGKTSAVSTGKTVGTMPYIIGALVWGNSATTNGYHCTCEVWKNKIIINGVLIQDLRPYVDEDGIPCFYDTVTNVKFYNEGTGTLSYTE